MLYVDESELFVPRAVSVSVGLDHLIEFLRDDRQLSNDWHQTDGLVDSATKTNIHVITLTQLSNILHIISVICCSVKKS